VSPPDPFPMLLNPYLELPDKAVVSLIESFPFALAFYILYNGFCQIWVDGDFDFEWAASHLPREFGGLKVTYFTQGPSATSGRTQGPATTSGRTQVQITVTGEANYESTAGRASAPQEISITHTIRCGSEIDVKSAILSSHVGRCRRCRTGVKLLINGSLEKVITIASHAAFAPRIYRAQPKLSFFRRYFNTVLGRVLNDGIPAHDQPQEPGNWVTKWWESVEIFAAGTDKKVRVRVESSWLKFVFLFGVQID